MAYSYEGDVLFCEEVPLPDIVSAAGTPCYVYSKSDIVTRFREYDRAFGDIPHAVCYAVKANSNLSILRLLAAEGAGFDIVSGGELFRVRQAGGDPAKTVFSGVGKTPEEIAEHTAEYEARFANPFVAASRGYIDEVIYPHSTRRRVALGLRKLRDKQLENPWKKHDNIPL